MHVFLITQYYPPEIGAAASRWSDYVSILINKGHKITVLCEMPNYPNSDYYNGYKNSWVKIEKISSKLTIVRSKAFASDRSSFLKKIIHYFVFLVSGLINSLKIKNYDLIIVSSPPLFVGIIALFLKKVKNINYLLDVRDLWPDSVFALGQLKKGLLYKLGKKLEITIYNSAKGFIFPVPGFKKYLINQSINIAKKPMFSLVNGVSENFIKIAKSTNIKSSKNFMVLYSGNIGLAQKLNTVIEAARLLKNYDIEFRFIGNGVCKKEIQNLSKSLSNSIYFHDSMPRNELIKWIKKSSVCLAPLRKNKLFNNAIPSKIFEYMACERPVIVGINGEIESFIINSGGGILIEPENSELLANCILSYFLDRSKGVKQGHNGMRYITKYFMKESLISQLIKDINKF